jgi:hypothetical protein
VIKQKISSITKTNKQTNPKKSTGRDEQTHIKQRSKQTKTLEVRINRISGLV